MTQPRDTAGQFAHALNTAPDLMLVPFRDNVEELRATLQDFLENALPGFGFNVDEGPISVAVDRMVDSLVDSHIDLDS